MKKLFVAIALMTTLVACNSQTSQESQTLTDSTTVRVDSTVADTTLQDTTKNIK
jgi:hypothetical protein